MANSGLQVEYAFVQLSQGPYLIFDEARMAFDYETKREVFALQALINSAAFNREMLLCLTDRTVNGLKTACQVPPAQSARILRSRI